MSSDVEKNKVTIVTGGAGGLGSELAAEAMKRGRVVIITGRNAGRLTTMAGVLRERIKSGNVIPFTCDISLQDDIDRLAGFIKSEKYIVEYLINNAGEGYFGRADKNRSPEVEKILGSNLTGMILLSSSVLSNAGEKHPLTIVNIMSTSALLGRATETVYCAAKWGARGFTEALRAELKGTGNKVIAVYPGGMKTSFWDNKERDISTFMNPAEVASQIATAVFDAGNIIVSDLTIVRP